MTKLNPISLLGLALAFVFSTSLIAQDKTEVSVQIKKEGKVIMDTTYQYEDDAEAKHAVKILEILSEDEKQIKQYEYTMTQGDSDHSTAMVIISEDGKTKQIKEIHKDSLEWISEEDEEAFDIFIDEEDESGEKGTRKRVKVIVSGDEHGKWVAKEETDRDGENVEVIVIKKKIGEDCDHEDGEEVEVFIEKKIKKKPKEQ